MFNGILIGIAIGLGLGIVIAAKVRQSAHQAVAKTLAEFAAVDQDTRSLVNRCYRNLAAGIRKELDKLLPR